jgi:DNA polymerase I
VTFQHHTVQGEDVRLVVLPRFSVKALNAFKAFARSETLFGLDVESTSIPEFEGSRKSFNPAIYRSSFVVPHGLDPAVYRRGWVAGERREMVVRTVQFGTRSEGWVLDAQDPAWRPWIVRMLSDSSKRFVSHNAAFDSLRVRFAFGVRLGDRSIDTLPMMSLIWPGMTAPTRGRSKGLKEVCEIALDDPLLADSEDELHRRFMDLYHGQKARLPASFEPGGSPCRKCRERRSWAPSARGFCDVCYREQVPRGGNIPTAVMEWGWDNIPIDDEVFAMYAGLDAIYVRRLLDWASAEVKRLGMAALSRREQRIKRRMTERSRLGMRVDREFLGEIMSEVGGEFQVARDHIQDVVGAPSGSPKVKDWLVHQGVPRALVKSLDKDHLPIVVGRYGNHDQYPEIAAVLDSLVVCQQHKNLLSNLTTIERHAQASGGRVHPNFNTLQAHTGRMSVTGPAMQTFSKTGLKGERLRGVFLFDEGTVGVGADYDNQEIRIGAGLSGDEMLLRIVRENLSQHVLTAESIFPDFTDKYDMPLHYHKAKTLDFAQQYGAGPKKIALQLGISYSEAKALWLAWRNTYAGLVDWSEMLQNQSWVRNPYGRLVPSDPFRPYANSNYAIQSTGRDMLGEAILSLEDAGWGQYLWLPVHDELVLQVPVDRAEEAAAALTEHMTTTLDGYGVRVPVLVPAEGEIIGERWRGL